jgi:diguanylate cyclase (GGDEF)-like protein
MTSFCPEQFLILVVDDINQNLSVIGSILEEVGYDTTFATSGEQALERVQMARPDLILLDLMMPGMNGLDVCEALKADLTLAELPIIFLTASQEKEHLLQAFDKGAVDYVTKPFNAPELLARVRTHLELKYTRDRLQKSLQEQARLAQELEKLANIDPLTEVWNRRHLLELAEREFHRADRYQRPFSVLMLDIDHFKTINDTYGHAVGDEALKLMAKTVLQTLRKTDYFGRFGGEEFVAFLPETDLETAIAVAERIRLALAEIAIPIDLSLIHMTVSIGVATHQVRDDSLDNLLKRSDTALYKAKKQGRNQAVADE